MANSIALRNLFTTEDTEEHRDVERPALRTYYVSTTYSRASKCHFLRSTRKWASSFNVPARSPKLSNWAQAALTSASAFLIDSSSPNSAGYVAFSAATSLPAVLPSCSDV